MDAAKISAADLPGIIHSLIQWGIHFGIKLMTAIFILCVGIWLANRITRSAVRVMELRKLEPSLRSFVGSAINILLKVFVGVIVLATVGIQMTSIVAVLGAASLAVGMALSGMMQNVAGGLVILLFKPFKVGDSIETASGKTGVVKRIMIFTTELHTFDNQVLFMPNGALANGIITNLSHGNMRRNELTVGVAYGDSVDVARRVVMGILAKDARIMANPAPVVYVSALGDSAVQISIRYWTKYADMFATTADLTERIYQEFPKKKLNFPFPQMDVHVVK